MLAHGSCDYEKCVEEKESRAQTAQAEHERNLAEAARVQAFVDRFGASATKGNKHFLSFSFHQSFPNI